MANQYTVKDLRIIKREPIYTGFVQLERVSLSYRLFQQNNYSEVVQRECARRKKAAGVLIYNDKEKQFLLIEQFRVGAIDDPISPWHLEIVAGLLDGDESPETCLYRESLEEADCTLFDLQHLFTFYPSAGASNELFYLYTAQAVLPTDGSIFGLVEEGENIQAHIFNYDELPQLFAQQRLRNAPVIMALQWLQQHIAALQ
ncbi:NUDIX domain-containing protein [Acinetobacter boissieri]|uniref:ADP-ribose pyrophosphatase n=1 Tax=Acinetobacter boissieri TaxID=1219383 RepID=A0A1G6HN63_9GAMM|nr:NUDIX domain-containing protein [Acinetobacter boissieri]SDB95747.1 ADP-ribose pyrophosphatase [Acinetobacter boissieri]